MARSKVGSQSMAVGIAGFALYWPTLRQFELRSLTAGYAQPEAIGVPLLMTVLVSMLVLGGVAIGARHRIELLFARRSRAAAVLACAGSLGAVLLLGAPACGVLQGPLFVVGASGLALGYLALTLAWASALLASERRRALTVVAVGYALSACSTLLELAGETWTLAFTVAAPLGSAVAWYCYGAGEPRRAVDYELTTLKTLPMLLVAMVVLFLFVGRVAVGAITPLTAQIKLVTRCIDIALAVVVMAGFLTFCHARGNGSAASWGAMLKLLWLLLALVVIAGLLLTGASWPANVGDGLVAAGFNCFELFLWVLLMRLSQEQGLSVTLAFCGVFGFCKVVPVFCGKLLAPQMARWLAAQGDGLLALLLLGLVFLLVAATFVFLAFGGSIGDPVVPVSPAPAAEPVSLDERARRWGLTPREAEVIGYVLMGFSYQKTADAMGVSLSTVQSHVKNLYRKLGVHTKDELVDWAASHTG